MWVYLRLNILLALLSLRCHHEELEQLWDIKTSILHDSCFCKILRISSSVMDSQIHVLNTLLHLQQSLALHLIQHWDVANIDRCKEMHRALQDV